MLETSHVREHVYLWLAGYVIQSPCRARRRQRDKQHEQHFGVARSTGGRPGVPPTRSSGPRRGGRSSAAQAGWVPGATQATGCRSPECHPRGQLGPGVRGLWEPARLTGRVTHAALGAQAGVDVTQDSGCGSPECHPRGSPSPGVRGLWVPAPQRRSFHSPPLSHTHEPSPTPSPSCRTRRPPSLTQQYTHVPAHSPPPPHVAFGMYFPFVFLHLTQTSIMA